MKPWTLESSSFLHLPIGRALYIEPCGLLANLDNYTALAATRSRTRNFIYFNWLYTAVYIAALFRLYIL